MRVRHTACWTFATMLLPWPLAGCGGRLEPPAIDQVLHRTDERYGTFGPTGERLFTERLETALGVRGQFSYLHFDKEFLDPIRVELAVNKAAVAPSAAQVDWFPSHIRIRWTAEPLTILEHKFITDDDCIVDLFEITNHGERAVWFDAEFRCDMPETPESMAAEMKTGARAIVRCHTFHGVDTFAVMIAPGCSAPNILTYVRVPRRLTKGCLLEPQETMRFRAVVGMASSCQAATARAETWAARRDVLDRHSREYQQWFTDNCPAFECDDAYINKCWWYRWYIARHCLSRARTGNLPYPCFFEGMHERWFPSLIAFSSPHIIAEVRWLRDPIYAFGQAADHTTAPHESGHFWSARVNWSGNFYTNWIPMATWEAYWVHPDRQWLAKLLPALCRDIDGVLATFDNDADRLPSPDHHGRTGMEWQPSFFYFNGYDNTKRDASMERGDFAAYLYGNARAVAAASRQRGQLEQANRYDRLADEIRTACLATLWDEQDGFFYAVRTNDHAKAPVREIVGFYPFMSRLVPDEAGYMRPLAYLADESEFWNTWPLTTVTKKCPVYSPHISTWPGPGGKTTGCMWNGPTWPHANAIMLDVMGKVILDYHQDSIRPEHFWRLLDRFTHLHFEGDDLNRPLLREYYDGQTAEPEGCPDYFHSTYNDTIIRYVAGLSPANSADVVLRPVPGPLKWFRLDNVRYRCHTLSIAYDSAGRYNGSVPRGYSLFVDGRLVAHRDDLGELIARNVVAAP